MIEHCALSHAAIGDFGEAIVVAGGRNFNDYAQFVDCLEAYLCMELPTARPIFISGKASRGPDSMIIRWCRENGRAWTEFPADWDDLTVPGAVIRINRRGKRYNAAAGHFRNRLMAQHATHVVCFWDGRSPGTRNMIDEARRCQIEPKIFLIDPDRKESNDQSFREESRDRGVRCGLV
ncbi:SLOG family protein [Caballeronia arationis]|uniref:SLOG family protein n=1 Tax=Caballeronia arationis TaxID=1777142 RepID=UPI000786D3AC